MTINIKNIAKRLGNNYYMRFRDTDVVIECRYPLAFEDATDNPSSPKPLVIIPCNGNTKGIAGDIAQLIMDLLTVPETNGRKKV